MDPNSSLIWSPWWLQTIKTESEDHVHKISQPPSPPFETNSRGTDIILNTSLLEKMSSAPKKYVIFYTCYIHRIK
jgi:hypothetical protein